MFRVREPASGFISESENLPGFRMCPFCEHKLKILKETLPGVN